MNTISELSKEQILHTLDDAMELAKGKTMKIEGQVFVCNLFFEDSTRTKVSFDIAERKLGLEVVPFDIATSSVNKGETLYDTVKTLESIGVQLAVIRHGKNEFYRDLKGISIPIINAGDGTGNHPSQTMLDLMTIRQEFGKFENLKVAIAGDIKHSRVANSLSDALRKLGAKVYVSGPREWFDVGSFMNGSYVDMDDLMPEVDVMMLLRIQHERHADRFSTNEYLQRYGLTKAREKKMKSDAIIMHPAPVNRGVEIDSDLVECSRSRIFTQMENGVYARMAILKNTLEKNGFRFS